MMRLKNTMTVLGVVLSGWLGLAAAAAQDLDAAVTIPSGSSVSDFSCGKASKPSPSTGTPSASTPRESVPSARELGAYAKFVATKPPGLDRKLMAGFDLLDRRDDPRPRRFAFWGDSHIAAGPMMAQLFDAIEKNNETVGTRFLPPTMGRSNVRLRMLHDYCIGEDWTTELAFKSSDTLMVGPGLANRVVTAGTDNKLWLDLRTKDLKPQILGLQIVYRPTATGTTLGISINDGPEQFVPLAVGNGGTGFLAVNSDKMIYTIKMRVTKGTFVLQGFRLKYRDPPTVTIDVFGLPGSTAQGWAQADPQHLAQALHGETYDGVVLEYGTNEGNYPKFDPIKYRLDLTVTLQNMRTVFPEASCLMIGPPDRGVLDTGGKHGDLLKYARIHKQIATIQQELARTFSCATWDWQAYMGGPGGNYGWAYADPMLMGRDLTHLSMDGYRRTGKAIATSLGWLVPER